MLIKTISETTTTTKTIIEMTVDIGVFKSKKVKNPNSLRKKIFGRWRKGKKAFKRMHGEAFDGFEWVLKMSSKQRQLARRYMEFHNDRLDFWFPGGWDETNDHWMCQCGHYEESGLHCSKCGGEPPWGCDCSLCTEPPDEHDLHDDYDEFDDGDL